MDIANRDLTFAYGLVRNDRTFLFIKDANLKQKLFDWAFQMMENDQTFAEDFGYTIGRTFNYLEDNMQEKALEVAGRNNQFANMLGYVGSCFAKIEDKRMQERVLTLANHNSSFAEKLSTTLPSIFSDIKDTKMQERILELAHSNKVFRDNFAQTIGGNIASINDPSIRKAVFKVIEDTSEFKEHRIFLNVENLNDEDRKKIWDIVKKNRKFAAALGAGIGDHFSSLQPHIQEEVLEIVAKYGEFGENFARNLSDFYEIRDIDIKFRILDLADYNRVFGYYVMFRVISNIYLEHEDVQEGILRLISKDDQIAFQAGYSIGQHFSHIEDEYLQDKLLDIARKKRGLALGLSRHLAEEFPFIKNNRIQERILQLAEQDTEFASNFAVKIGSDFLAIPHKELQERIWQLAERNPRFASKIGSSFGYNLNSINNRDFQQMIWEMVEQNRDFAIGFAESLALRLCYEEADVPRKAWYRADEDCDFAMSLGYGIGKYLYILNKARKIVETIWPRCARNGCLAYGLGYGLAYYDTSYFGSEKEPDEDLPISRMDTPPYFLKGFRGNVRDSILQFGTYYEGYIAYGFGVGLHNILQNANKPLPSDLIELQKKNRAFADGLNFGRRSNMSIPLQIQNYPDNSRRSFTDWWGTIPLDVREKARKNDEQNKPLLNQINYVLVHLHLNGRHDLKPTYEELKEWLHNGQIDIIRIK